MAREIDSRQVFDRLAGTWTYWGWKGGYFASEEDARAFFDELALHARDPARRAELAAVVQHRPPLGLRHRRPRPGPLLRRPLHQAAGAVASPSYEHPQPHACFIQSVNDDLVNDGGIMDLWVREARLFKYGSGTGSNFSQLRGEGERLSRRRQVVGPDELPQDRRPRRGRHQVGRHHPPRRQDGRRRHRSPRYRDLHQLEGEGGAEGRRPRHRLQDRQQAPQGHHEGRGELRGQRRRLLRRQQEPGAQARGPRRQEGAGARELHPARHPVRPPGLHRHGVPDLRHRLGQRGLPHRLRPELEQLRPRHRRLPQGRRDRWRLAAQGPRQPQGRQDPQGPRPLGPDRLRRLGLGRPGHPVPHHHQRVAHEPGRRPDRREQPVLGVHVPRRHRVQPRLGQPPALPQRRRHASTSPASSTPAGSGRSSSRSR